LGLGEGEGVVSGISGAARVDNIDASPQPAPSPPGENAAAQYGRMMHDTYDYGQGYEKEVKLPNGQRADAVNVKERIVAELKPDTPSSIRKGLSQLRGYATQLEKKYPGKPWRTKLITYPRYRR
jgi:hypothetical protein